MSAVAQEVQYVHLTCGACTVEFWITEALHRARKKDGETFYCPNGHPRCFRDSDITKLEREKKELERQRDNLTTRLQWSEDESRARGEQRDAAERRARSLRGHATRLRNRIAQGKCPCCAEVFGDIAAHIAEKHPRYRSDEG